MLQKYEANIRDHFQKEQTLKLHLELFHEKCETQENQIKDLELQISNLKDQVSRYEVQINQANYEKDTQAI